MKTHITKSSSRGFSLIEVLIVIAVLSLLLILGAQQLGGQLSKARDARRKADLDTIKKVFEDYASDRSQYPPFGVLNNCGDASGTVLAGYIQEIPCDPDGTPYIYLPYPDFGDTTGGFRVFAKLEQLEDPDIAVLGCNFGIGCGLSESIVSPSPELYNYGVSEGIPVYYSSGGESEIPTHGICCPPENYTCRDSALINGICPGDPPTAPFATEADCIQYTHCTAN